MTRWPEIAFAALIASAATIALAAPSDRIEPARAAHLTALVREDCGSCHGMTLKGGLGVALLPRDLDGKDAESLAAIILDGVPGTPMPPWRGLLSEADARWIAENLKQGFPK